VLVIDAGSRRRRFRSYDLKRIKHRLARWCYRAIAWLERYRFEAAARDETASTESARWGAWAVADVLNDALCRLQREFLHAERHKDDNHDPAEDGQQTIRAAAVFSDIKRYFHVSCFFEDWSRLAREMRVRYGVRAAQHRCHIHLQFPAHNDVHAGPRILRIGERRPLAPYQERNNHLLSAIEGEAGERHANSAQAGRAGQRCRASAGRPESKPAQRAKTRAAKAWFGTSGTLSRFCVVRGA
jgi:hypothetical protein